MNTQHMIQHSNIEQVLAQRCLQSCKKLLFKIEQAKNWIAKEFHATKASQEALFSQAINEAEALAWETKYPHLFFPSLAIEKVQAVAVWQKRQRSLNRHQSIFAEAA